MILGHPWLERHNPQINWQHRTVELSALDNANKATQIAQVHQQKDNRPLKEKVPPFLHNYLDVFQDVKEGEFPPSRGIHDHRIMMSYEARFR